MENKSGVALIALLFIVIFLIGLMYACENDPTLSEPGTDSPPQPYVEPEPAPGHEPVPAPVPEPAPAPDVQYDDEYSVDVLPETGGMPYEG